MVSGHLNLPGDELPIGGVQRHVSCLTDEMIKRRYVVQWCYPSQAKWHIEKMRSNIVISNDFCSFVEKCSVPQILVFHGYEGDIPPKKDIIKKRLQCEKESNASICVGNYLVKWYGHKPDKVIWGGVNQTPYLPPPRAKRILYLGRLDADQSPEIVFEALGQTKNKYTIEVCAKGRQENEIKKIVKKYDLLANFNGFVDNVDVHIKKSDIVICSGYLTILESYINRRPVISPYGNELKKDYLNLVWAENIDPKVKSNPPCKPFCLSSVENMAKYIDSVYKYIDSKEAEMVIENNYKFALQNTWSKVADIYEELIKKCLSKN